MFTNKYIFIYASILVIVVAAILSAAAMFLQPFQQRNVKVEKIQDILNSAGIASSKENAEALFRKHIVAEILINRQGQVVHDERNAFDVDLKSELRKLEELEAGKATEEPVFPLFICELSNEKIVIIPVFGKGLWGPLWGYIALRDDFNTVVGAVFDHKGETPGLGSEISTEMFQKRFIDKKIFDEDGHFVSVAVVKGGVAKSPINPANGVDALSGSTITCNGLANMIKNCLENYVKYFQNQRVELIREIEEQRIADSIADAQAQEVVVVPRPRIIRAPEPEPEPVLEQPEKEPEQEVIQTTTIIVEDPQ